MSNEEIPPKRSDPDEEEFGRLIDDETDETDIEVSSNFEDLLVEAYFDELAREHPDQDWAESEARAKLQLLAEPLDGIRRKVPINTIYTTTLASLVIDGLEKPWAYEPLANLLGEDPPRLGDLMLVQVESIGSYDQVENATGARLKIDVGQYMICTYASRYAERSYRGRVPRFFSRHADLLSRSGIIGEVVSRHSQIGEPTKLKVLGRVLDQDGNALSTVDRSPLHDFEPDQDSGANKSKMILVVGDSLEVGEGSATALKLVKLLRANFHEVNAARITGSASGSDRLEMESAGVGRYESANTIGYPSTDGQDADQLLKIFNYLDNECASKPENFWIAEVSDSPLQAETAALLRSEIVQRRTHTLVLSASNAIDAIGAVTTLENLWRKPDVITGSIADSTLAQEQLADGGMLKDIPVVDLAAVDDAKTKEFLRHLRANEDHGA